MRRHIRLATALALVAASVAAGGSAGAGGSGTSPVTTPPKVVTRDYLDGGVTKTVSARATVAVTVSDTKNLRGLQQIDVSWTGAYPTQGITGDPNSLAAAELEYPFVLLECRGTDSATVPADQQVTPQTCFTSSPRERFANDLGFGFPPWRLDLYAPPDERKAVVGVDPQNYPSACNPYRSPAEHWVPFTASGGHVYLGGPNGCAGQPPEAVQNTGDLAFPSNETFAVTAPDGSGSAKFVVHTSAQNASLGCSDTVACALVAIPIMGISCDAAGLGLPVEDRAPTSTVDPNDPSSPTIAHLADNACTSTGILPRGSGPPPGEEAVSGTLWWAASNWRNRITVPLNFAPVGDPCSTTSQSGGIEIYGSELLIEATSQWNPHFCGNDKLFTIKHVQYGEPAARRLVEKNIQDNLKTATDKLDPLGVKAAFSSYAPTGTYTAPVVSAPVALTGFAISFAMNDKSGHAMTKLNLDARLLAKLLTESYPSSLSLKNNYSTPLGGGKTSTALRKNPQTMVDDEEFKLLNPDAPTSIPYFDAASTLFALSSDSDVMYALTSYIINDPEASAWLAGASDPWGMVVNPHYATTSNEISLPTASWRSLDPAADANSTDAINCTDLKQIPYLASVASPTSSLPKIVLAIEFSHSLSSVVCHDFGVGQLGQEIFNLTRPDRQQQDKRFILGVTSIAEANRYQLDTASLQTQAPPGAATDRKFSAAGRTFVAPTDASLQAAAKLLVADPATGTWQLPPDAIRAKPENAGAYPGTMVVYSQVPTLGLSQTDASHFAQFLRFAASDGQTPGTATGQLPPGCLPMTDANGLGALAAYTKVAAAAVEAQVGEVPPLYPGEVKPSAGSSSSQSPSASGSASSGGNGGSPTATSSGLPGASSGPQGGISAFGPGLSGGRSGAAQSPVNAPGGILSGPLAVIGKTIRIISRAAGTIVLWLLYLAVGALGGAGAFWVVARRRGVKLGLKGLIAAIKEWLQGLARHRRAPH